MEPLSDVVVWETSRPLIHPTQFTSEIEGIGDKKGHIVRSFRAVLEKRSVKGPDEAPFWNWLETIASEEQLVKLYNYVRRKLPLANGFVATFNPALSFCTSSHNNACLLGSMSSARSAMFYIIPYEAKRKVKIEQGLPILEKTLQHMRRHPSKAVDSGTTLRTVSHFLQRVLNRMHLRMELSDWQVAASLLDLPSSFTTDAFEYCDPTALSNLHGRLEIEQDRNKAFSIICGELLTAETQAASMKRQFVHKWFRPVAEDVEETPDAARVVTAPTALPTAATPRPAYDRYVVGKELGQIIDFKLNKGSKDRNSPERRIIIPRTAYYYFRGDADLQDVTYYEYSACVKVKLGKLSDEPKKKKFDARITAKYPFHDSFIGRTDAYHQLRVKQCTPLTIGTPPRYPGARPIAGTKASLASWTDHANQYARYYLAFFRPFAPGLGTTWEDLKVYETHLRNSPRIIDTFRLMMMEQHMDGMKVPGRTVRAARAYRGRARQKWTPQEKSRQAADLARENQLRKHMQYADHGGDSFDIKTTKQRRDALQRWGAQHAYDRAQVRALQVFSDSVPAYRRENSKRVRGKRLAKTILSSVTPQDVIQIYDGMKQWKSEADSSVGKKRERPTVASVKERKKRMRRVVNALKEHPSDGDTQQTTLLKTYLDALAEEREWTDKGAPPRILLLHGAPGTGKSKTRDAFDKFARICGRYNLKLSFNAVNAAEMGGDTVCTCIGGNQHASDTGVFAASLIQELRDKGFQRESIITLEEFETNAPCHLARLDKACQIANGNTESFGGCLVILVGDLGQLSPVRVDTNLTDAVMDANLADDLRPRKSEQKKAVGNTVLPADRKKDNRYQYNNPRQIGQRLLIGAKWFELTEQKRSEDRVHTKSFTTTYHQEVLTMGVMKQRGYKTLSKEEHPEEWLYASALVATNRERYSLTHHRAIDLAKYLGVPVLRWKANLANQQWDNKPASPEDQNLAQFNDPCCWEYFVPGVHGYLFDAYMRNLRLINGTEVIYRSLCFDEQNKADMKQMLANAEPGEVYEIEKPEAVIVEVCLPKQTSPDVTKALLSFSLDKTKGKKRKIVLPIYPQNSKESKTLTPLYGEEGRYAASAIRVKAWFPLELALAITIHKALGRTMERVILCLSRNAAQGCNISYRQLHVALSRVKERSHIRLLLLGETEEEKWLSLSYLCNLKPDKSIKYFFAGYRPFDSDEPNRNWQTDCWSADRANDWYRNHLAVNKSRP